MGWFLTYNEKTIVCDRRMVSYRRFGYCIYICLLRGTGTSSEYCITTKFGLDVGPVDVAVAVDVDDMYRRFKMKTPAVQKSNMTRQ
jgi:hypothetical protein